MIFNFVGYTSGRTGFKNLLMYSVYWDLDFIDLQGKLLGHSSSSVF